MKRIVLLLLSCFIFVSVYTQNADNKLIDRLVQKGVLTHEEAQEILSEEKQKSSDKDWESIKSLINNKYLQLGGYAQLLYSYDNTKSTKHNGAVRTAFLSVKGEPLNKLSYLIFINLRDPSLTEYYVDWTPFNSLQFRVGQQKVPISIENQLSLSALEFIQNTRTVNYLVGGSNDVLTIQNGKNSGGRDIGIKAYGNLFANTNGHSYVEYGLGIYQGSGINKSALRSDKDFVANILISPIKGFRVGGGIQFGEAEYALPHESRPNFHGRNRWLVSTDFKVDNFYARAEWIKGNDSNHYCPVKVDK